jgi:hypothetical protein
MFQLFIGNPSITAGLSLQEELVHRIAPSSMGYNISTYMFRCSVISFTVRLICGWVGALAAVAYIPSISQSFELQKKKCTHVRDHIEYMGWHKGCVEMGVCRDAKG